MTRNPTAEFRARFGEAKTGVGAGVIAAVMLLAAATYQTASAEHFSQESTLDTPVSVSVEVLLFSSTV